LVLLFKSTRAMSISSLTGFAARAKTTPVGDWGMKGSKFLVDPTSCVTPYDSTKAQFKPLYIEQTDCTPFNIEYSYLGKYGATGKGILSGPALSNTDFSILKDLVFKERFKVQFRSEFFNAFNQVNFHLPDNTVTDGPGSFGVIFGADPGRVIQFALKVYW
jgi:hypothetical protein